jgi:hypothetical protein
MDKTDETRSDDQLEYVAPMIVDYGDIVEITAQNTTGGHTDVPLGGPANHLS